MHSLWETNPNDTSPTAKPPSGGIALAPDATSELAALLNKGDARDPRINSSHETPAAGF